MTREQKSRYEDVSILKNILMNMKGRKFKLDCGHHVTIGHNLASDIVIYNGNKEMKIKCTLCSY